METPTTLCPFCESLFVAPVPPAGLLDQLATFLSLHPFQCESCKKRFRLKVQGGQPPAGHERRKAIRVAVRIPITFESNEVSGEGMLTDMSLHGCSLESQQPLRTGLVIKLNLPAGKGQKPGSTVQQLATVVVLNGTRAGLKFLAYSFQEKTALTQTVTQSVKIYARKS
jgi:hypothetical protein